MPTTEKLTVISDAPGRRLFMLGNEAIARGAIEAGLQVYAAYPGTPSTEISETLINLAKESDYYAEWSVNEKVAFEVAFGASMCGVRAMTSLKNAGLNVAHEPLMSATYMGAIGGMVLVDADDPGQWSSQNEQDNRYIAQQAYMPVLEPSSPQEAKDMTAEAFNLSEKFGQIFMLRTVTRLSHARGDVVLGEINKNKAKGKFEKNERLVCMPAWSRKNRVRVIERLDNIRAAVNDMPFNRLSLVPGAKIGIIACGLSFAYTKEALQLLGLDDKVSVLKLASTYPVPDKLVLKLLAACDYILVVEELEPFVEDQVKIIAQEAGITKTIHGKDLVPIRLELSTRKVAEAVSQLTGINLKIDFNKIDAVANELAPLLPERPPTLCAGCPHRASFYVINAAVRKVKDLGERVISGDIGCYGLGIYPPLYGYDTATCMGAGFGIGGGISHAHPGPVIGQMGDSTFFHSGIAPMINAVFNKTKITMMVLDNSATAMTGFQPNPCSPDKEAPPIKPEDVARACQVQFVEVVSPFETKKAIDVMVRALRFDGPSLVVMRQQCEVVAQHERRNKGTAVGPYHIVRESCNNCKLCVNTLGCPAILIENDQVIIDASQCAGCGICAQVCARKSIVRDGGN